MNEIRISKATPLDIASLQKIGRQTFHETFAESNSEENIAKYLEEGFSSEKIARELSDPDSDIYFAISGNETIGYLKLNSGESQTELKDPTSLEIERIYVLKEFHGKKVAQALYAQAVKTASEKNASYIWLGVWEENPRAISFYKKNGFVEFDKHIFRLGNEEQTDIMMKLVLK